MAEPRSREYVQSQLAEMSCQIVELEKKRRDLIEAFGVCGRWMDGHSHRKCGRLLGHDGRCSTSG